jgi:integrase/recombinase XerD
MTGRTLPKTLNRDEVELLLAQPNLDAVTGLRDRAIMELMLGAGFRRGECCKVHLRDVDWSDGMVRLRPEVAKYGHEAVLPLDDRTLDWLKRWKGPRRQLAQGAPFLFVTHGGRPLIVQDVTAMVARRARKAGIARPVSPHVLRHTYATQLLADGFDVRQVQKLMRHRHLETTAIYLEVRPEVLAERVRSRRR